MAKFAHLHVHSHYSLLDGLAKIDELVKEAARLEMPALALTDHGALYGLVEFYKEAKKSGIKPIMGIEAYVVDKMRERQPREERHHLTLLAENEKGYRNLVELSTKSHLEGFYYKPRIDKEELRQHREGLICLSGCFSGAIARAVQAGDTKRAEKLVDEYKDIFGKENFFIEVGHHPGIDPELKVKRLLIELAKQKNTPIAATHDVHYVKPEDKEAQDILVAVQTNSRVDDEDRLTMKNDDFSLRSPQEMGDFFKETPEAIHNTIAIAERASFDFVLGRFQLPHFEVPTNYTPESYLEELAYQGLKRRFGNELQNSERRKLLEQRLKYELGVIKKTGFASYFLIVHDIINFARQRDISYSARGSVGGSLVSYVLNITNIDPIAYNLFFERFLNPDRISPPDIDLDFADTRRNEVLEYISQKYGYDRVAQIITFGTMAARAAIRDAGRAMGYPYSLCDQLAKMIPFNKKLDHSLRYVSDFRAAHERDPEAKRLIDAARRLEGVVRHASTHACGVVITKEPLTTILPLQRSTSADESSQTGVITQYEMRAVEDLGLLKMDILGLRNLTIIESTIKLIKERHHQDISLEELPLDDTKAFKLLAEGRTIGIFQLESGGMRRYLKELKPTEMEDIIAMVSLYRPGPMELIPSFIHRKHGKEPIAYLDPRMEPILSNTYGIMVYQEQLMQVARDLAGFTLAQADTLRKAIGKKIRSLLIEQREKLIEGMRKNGIRELVAEKIWALIEPFDRYGFNRSHGACYALIAYQTAWLKSHYPIEFMTALLNAEATKDVERATELVEEAKSLSIEVLPPEINQSQEGFSITRLENDKEAIRFGLAAIKNVGTNVVRAIIEERNNHGPFTSLADFLLRIESKDLNKKSLESLIKVGALDQLSERKTMLDHIEGLLEFARAEKRKKAEKQESLFQNDTMFVPQLTLKQETLASEQEKLRWEKELIGLYVSGHPLQNLVLENLANSLSIASITPEWTGRRVNTIGILTSIKRILTKTGKPMLFAKIEDKSGTIEMVVFPDAAEASATLLKEEGILVVGGRVSQRNGVLSIIAEKIEDGEAKLQQTLILR